VTSRPGAKVLLRRRYHQCIFQQTVVETTASSRRVSHLGGLLSPLQGGQYWSHTVEVSRFATPSRRQWPRWLLRAAASTLLLIMSIVFLWKVALHWEAHRDKVATAKYSFHLFFELSLLGLVVAAAIALVVMSSKRQRPWLADKALRYVEIGERSTWTTIGVGSILLLCVGVWCYTNDKDGFDYTLGNIIVSAAATVLVAFGGWFVFQLTFGFFMVRRLC
jgi:hypothetical protein